MENPEELKRDSLRKPGWLLKKIEYTDERRKVNSILRDLHLNTVCRSARCPNLSECYRHRRATFLILGDICTRGCTFCSVEKAFGRKIDPPDPGEPARVARAVEELGLRYVVITSVTRDDLEDGGARQFVQTIERIRTHDQGIRIEVLTPDFRGDELLIEMVARANPDVYNHNVETVPRLYPTVRPGAEFERSLHLLSYIHEHYPGMFLKSGLMVGLGETEKEVQKTVSALKEVGCDALTIGQYLRPSHWNIPVHEYLPPKRFSSYKRFAEKLGFRYVAAGPYVRSSYMAHEGYEILKKN